MILVHCHPANYAAMNKKPPLTPQETIIINGVRDISERIDLLINDLAPIADKRWLSLSRDDLQKGFMSAIRAVAEKVKH